jgi:hypothetical protein
MLLLVAVFVFSASGQEYRMVLAEAGLGRGAGQDFGAPEDRIVVSPPPYERRD